MTTKNLAAPQSSPLPHPLASAIGEAWRRYRALFGQPPHGTDQQIAALLDLLPNDDPIVRRVNQGPAFDAMEKALKALCAWQDHPSLTGLPEGAPVAEWAPSFDKTVKMVHAALKLAQEVK